MRLAQDQTVPTRWPDGSAGATLSRGTLAPVEHTGLSGDAALSLQTLGVDPASFLKQPAANPAVILAGLARGQEGSGVEAAAAMAGGEEAGRRSCTFFVCKNLALGVRIRACPDCTASISVEGVTCPPAAPIRCVETVGNCAVFRGDLLVRARIRVTIDDRCRCSCEIVALECPTNTDCECCG